ncbi:MAG TPA: AcvB/VirJ family lysyl-phosphatidylglycerol hydrolase [Ideonella sp.]|nr:AcvB/VirJ family lysyl-phosphatidylglycerol hydrolase [Ideonella sp.]
MHGIVAAALLALAAATTTAARAETLSHGFFKDVEVSRPRGEVKQFVLLLAGSGRKGAAPAGNEGEAAAMARTMTGAGAMVARIDVDALYTRLEAEGGTCSFADGALENLAHHVQAFYKLPTYSPAIVVGQGQGSAMAYAMLAQAAPGTFAGGVSVGFCPELTLKKPLCPGRGLALTRRTDERGIDDGARILAAPTLNAPWVALQAEDDPQCGAKVAQAFVDGASPGQLVSVPGASLGEPGRAGPPAWLPSFEAAFTRLAATHTALAPPPASLAGLPIVEVPAEPLGPGKTNDNAERFAVLLSGDGGWAGIDKGLAAALAKDGIPVAGFDSLRYFWSARTPLGLAADLDRIIRYYAARWNRRHVMLIGYSQGADVLPFAINRLPAATRARVQSTVLLGLGQKASFEFHVANWIGKSGDRPIAPEAKRLSAADTVCIYGTEEKNSLCPMLAPHSARPLPLSGGHHFGGEYDKLAALIVEQSRKR